MNAYPFAQAALDFRNVSIVANYISQRTKNAQFISQPFSFNFHLNTSNYTEHYVDASHLTA